MTTDKPSRNEDEYFARQDMELVQTQRERAAAEQAAAERRSHLMKCPKDGYDLRTEMVEDIPVDVCDHCHGLWLDAGELEKLLHQKEPNFLNRVVGDVLATLRGRRGEGRPVG